MAVEHSTYVCGVEACPAKRTSDSDVTEVADGYRARSCLETTAVVVQADALERRRVDVTVPRNFGFL